MLIPVQSSLRSPGTPSLHSLFGHPGVGDGRRDPGCRGQALAGRPPGQPQHELIKRHQGRSDLCLGGRSRKTLSSSQPSTVMARTRRDAAPRQRALAHPSLAEHHSYPPQPCFCQLPKPSPAELLTAPAAPCGRRAAPVWVITETLTGPALALPCHSTPACHPPLLILPYCLYFSLQFF